MPVPAHAGVSGALRRLLRAATRRWQAPLLGALVAAAAPVLSSCSPPDDAMPAARPACRSRSVAASEEQIRWVDAAQPRDAAALARWCAAVGPPVLANVAAAAQPVDSLIVVSWNVHVGGGDIAALVADLRAGKLTGGRPPQAFVLLLQEAYRAGSAVPANPPLDVVPHRIAPVPPRGTREDVVAVARRTGLSLLYIPSMRNGIDVTAAARATGTDTGSPPLRAARAVTGPGEDRGNAILSTLPLAQPEAIVLPLESQRRVAAAALVSARTGAGAAWTVKVVAVHLDHRAPWLRALQSFGVARARQAAALASALRAGGPTILGADLNTWSFAGLEGAVPYLRSEFPSTPAETLPPTFYIGLGLARRLDHVFFRLPPAWHARVERVNDRYGSDHYPLIAVLRFGGR